MRRIYSITVFVLLVTLLQSCTMIPDGAVPTDHDKTKWVAQEIDMYFEVDDKYIPVNYTNTYGEVTQNDITTSFCVLFDYGSLVVFRSFIPGNPESSSELDLFKGTCKFGEKKLVVDVRENDFLDSSIKQITFIREDLE